MYQHLMLQCIHIGLIHVASTCHEAPLLFPINQTAGHGHIQAMDVTLLLSTSASEPTSASPPTKIHRPAQTADMDCWHHKDEMVNVTLHSPTSESKLLSRPLQRPPWSGRQ